MRYAACLLWLLMLLPVIALAKPFDADIASSTVDIDHNFKGINVLLFGARNDIGRIVVALRGPKEHFIVRKKERIAGMWVNRKSMEFSDVDGFFSLAASSPLNDINNPQLIQSLQLDEPRLDYTELPEGGMTAAEIASFHLALTRYMETRGLYTTTLQPVTFWGETLFRTLLPFPKTVERGWYVAEVYLIDDGMVSAMQSTPIQVRKTGVEAAIYELARHHSMLYGLLSVVLAIATGWCGSKLFAKVR